MIDVTISKTRVMQIVEGLSVDIAQKNSGTVPFESLWASQDDIPKLSLYYREAVSDLEKQVMRRLGESHALFTLQDNGDYTLHVTAKHWLTTLRGLLENKVQDYLVHSTLAGWLNGFSGLDIKADYASMASQDLNDIVTILSQKSYRFAEAERSADDDAAPSSTESVKDREEDGVVTASDGSGPNTSMRKADDCHKNLIAPHERPHHRHHDMVPIHHHRDETDWSGSGMEEMKKVFGRHFNPSVHGHECHGMCGGYEMPPEDPNCECETGRSKAGECDTRKEWEF